MLDLAEQQRDRGADVRFYGMTHPENDLTFSLSPLPSHVEFEPPPARAGDRARLFARMVWSREALLCLDTALESWRPDVIHCHNIYHQLSPSLLAVAKRRGIPVVLTMHDYKLICPTYQFLDKGALCTACVTGGLRQAAKRACQGGSRAASTAAAVEVWLHRRMGAYAPVHRFLAPSRFLADQMRSAGVFADRIEVLDNFTDVRAVRPQTEPGSGLVYVGRLSQEKGVDCAIRSWGALCSEGRIPARATLEIVGDGPDRQALEMLAHEVAAGRVTFHGRVSKARVSELVRAACATVAASTWYENQPLAVLESFAAGVPVIATRLGGLPEIVHDGVTGWLFERGDDRALKKALEEAVTQPARSRSRGAAARRVAEERFDAHRHVEAIERIYAELVA